MSMFCYQCQETAKNQGCTVVGVCGKKEDVAKAIEILHKFSEASNACIIGKVTQQYPQKVILNSSWGTKRFLDTPSGELLPRIC